MNTARAHWRPLLALTAAVAAAHLWLLQGVSGTHAAPPPVGRQTLLMRTILAAPSHGDSRTSAMTVRPGRRAAPATPGAQRRAAPDPIASVRQAAAPAPPGAPLVAPPEPEPLSVATPESAGMTLAFAIPASVRLRYQVTAHRRHQLWQGAGLLDWRHDGSSYQAILEVSAPLLPTRRQQSEGTITAQGLAPARFSDHARSEEAAHFERGKGKVSFSSNRPDAALMAGAQDRLSVMLQLGAMIAGDPQKYRPPATIAIQTAGTRDAEPWHFTIEGDEQLQLPGGTIDALKLIRNPRKEYDQKVELWLSPAMDYVPVRLRLTQPNGDWVDQQWSSTDKG